MRRDEEKESMSCERRRRKVEEEEEEGRIGEREGFLGQGYKSYFLCLLIGEIR